MANVVGSLYVDILARVDTLEKDLTRARAMIDSTDASFRKAGAGAKAAQESFSLFNSFQGRGMLGIVSDMTALTLAFNAVKREVMYVYDNIEKIPSVPAEARASVMEFKANFFDLQQTIHKVVATGMGWFLQAGKMIGVGAQMWAEGYKVFLDALQGGATFADALAKMQAASNVVVANTLETVDKLKAAEDPAYWDKVAASRLKMSEARKADAVASQTLAGRIAELRVQAEQYEKAMKSSSISTLERLDLEAKAYNKKKEAHNIERELNEKFTTADRNLSREMQLANQAEMTQLQRIIELRRLYNKAWDFKLPEETNAKREMLAQRIPDITLWGKALRDELARVKTPIQEFRDSFISSFSRVDEYLTSFVTGGKLKLNDFLKEISDTLIRTFLKLAIVNPLLNSVFGGGAGGALMPALWGVGATKGKADGGMASGWTLVGERGPELVNMGSGSFTLTNGETRNRLGGGGGNTYMIDARGADIGAVERLEAALIRLAGPGVVEQRALSAAIDSRWRHKGGF